MKTIEFLTLLNEHSQKELLFEYTPNKFVGANYHITEIKNISVDAVDCGAGTDHWKETIIQLWESPEEKDREQCMSSYKALAILNKVDRIRTMDRNAEVKFEYSNPDFHTAQLFANDFGLSQNKLIIKLSSAPTDCKAKELCGVSPEDIKGTADSCAPGSGCC